MATDILCVPKHSAFLSLPGEIRNRIYHILLVVPNPCEDPGRRQRIELYTDPSSDDERLRSRIRGLNCPSRTTGLDSTILATCRQILLEASPILYGDNSFSMWVSDTPDIPRLISPYNLNLLRDISIYSNGTYVVPNQYHWDKAFRHCSSLERLNIGFEFIVSDEKWDAYQDSKFWFFKWAQNWIKSHPSIRLAMSPWPTGQERTHSHFMWLNVSFLATREDYYQGWPGDEHPVILDLDGILNDLRLELGTKVRKQRGSNNRKRP